MIPQIFQPSADLAPYVKCYWTLDSEPEHTPSLNTIVPDGTMKLIFHYGDSYQHHPSGQQCTMLPRCFLIGQLTRPYVVEPTGRTGTFMIRFHPNGFFPFATLPIKELENTAVPLDRLYGEAGLEIGANILLAASTQERIELAEAFLRSRLSLHPETDPILHATVENILNSNGHISVSELSGASHIHRRQLVRKYNTVVGLSPKQLSKTARIQAALKVLLNAKAQRLTDLAYDNDYFDQAHFIKEFKAFTGITPKGFSGDALRMSLIFDKET